MKLELDWRWIHDEFPHVPVEECERIFTEEVLKNPPPPGETPIDSLARSHRISDAVMVRVASWRPS